MRPIIDIAAIAISVILITVIPFVVIAHLSGSDGSSALCSILPESVCVDRG